MDAAKNRKTSLGVCFNRSDDGGSRRDQPAWHAAARQGRDDDVRLSGVHGDLLSGAGVTGVGRTRRRLRRKKGRHLRLGRPGIRRALGVPGDMVAMDSERRLVSGHADFRGRRASPIRSACPIWPRTAFTSELFCIVVYWLATVVVLQGVEVFAKISNWTFMVGTVLPGIVLLLLFGYWVMSGHPIGWQHLTERSGIGQRHARVLAGYSGIGNGRVSCRDRAVVCRRRSAGRACHRHEESEPRISIGNRAGSDSLFASLCRRRRSDRGDLAVPEDLSAIRRVRCIRCGDRRWLASRLAGAILSLLVGIGAIAGVFAWLGSPSRGLLRRRDDGELPQVLQKTNSHDMPTNILLGPGRGRNGDVVPVFRDQGRFRRLLLGFGDDGRSLSHRLHVDVRGCDQASLFRTESRPALHSARRYSRHVDRREVSDFWVFCSASWWRSSRPLNCRWDRPRST